MSLSQDRLAQVTSLEPHAVLRYLGAHGWTFAENYGRGQIWQFIPPDSTDTRPFQVLVPLDAALRDYPERMAELLDTLGTVEDRRPSEILRGLFMPSSDTQYLRLQPLGPPGTAPLLDVVPALIGLQELMLSAATSALSLQPQSVQPPVRPSPARNFVGGVRLGQTQVGSYIIAVQTALPQPEPQQLSIFDTPSTSPAEPFERKVSRTLYAGILSARDAAEHALKTNDLSLFERFAPTGLSANLCEALVKIGGKEGRDFDLRFNWSPDYPIGLKTHPLTFRRRSLQVLADGAKDLRARLGEHGVRVRGTVVRLHREASEGPGEVTISGYTLGDEYQRNRRYRMFLAAEPYSEANRAHDQGHEVQVLGDVEMSGNRAHIRPVHQFQVINVD